MTVFPTHYLYAIPSATPLGTGPSKSTDTWSPPREETSEQNPPITSPSPPVTLSSLQCHLLCVVLRSDGPDLEERNTFVPKWFSWPVVSGTSGPRARVGEDEQARPQTLRLAVHPDLRPRSGPSTRTPRKPELPPAESRSRRDVQFLSLPSVLAPHRRGDSRPTLGLPTPYDPCTDAHGVQWTLYGHSILHRKPPYTNRPPSGNRPSF